jgi:hypothetical protein
MWQIFVHTFLYEAFSILLSAFCIQRFAFSVLPLWLRSIPSAEVCDARDDAMLVAARLLKKVAGNTVMLLHKT